MEGFDQQKRRKNLKMEIDALKNKKRKMKRATKRRT